ncbi:MAG: ThuA domain-containing protein [Kiritimatiellae bacterium]|nr:ThuA domain-containing protein [Kiritimatiellia bacterium]
MNNHIRIHTMSSLLMVLAGVIGAPGKPPTEEQMEKIRAAIPDRPQVAPRKPRRLLVFSLTKGFRHSAVECGAFTLLEMGRKTGAYTAEESTDPAVFAAASLQRFDAVAFNNTTGELFDDPALKSAFMSWVRAGGGVVGIHAATDTFYKWPEFGEMMGGYFDGHPWHEKVVLRIEEPDHPLLRAFGGRDRFEVTDEIYQFRDPYSRSRLRVLISLDPDRIDMTKKGIKRTDRDFAVSWVRRFGEGRVFYCSLGHREEIFWNTTVLTHFLDGIQFALGDLPADATPRPGPR